MDQEFRANETGESIEDREWALLLSAVERHAKKYGRDITWEAIDEVLGSIDQ